MGAGGRSEGEPAWFRWFYHKEQRVVGHPLDPAQLARAVRRAALALGLDVYGGDAIVTRAGGIVLLDAHAGPSFALYREAAAGRTAAHGAFPWAGRPQGRGPPGPGPGRAPSRPRRPPRPRPGPG